MKILFERNLKDIKKFFSVLVCPSPICVTEGSPDSLILRRTTTVSGRRGVVVVIVGRRVIPCVGPIFIIVIFTKTIRRHLVRNVYTFPRLGI